MNRIGVNLDKKRFASYEICIGENITDRMGMLISKNRWASRYIILTDSNVSTLHGEKVQATLKGMDLKVDLLEFPAGEASKNIQTILPQIGLHDRRRMGDADVDQMGSAPALCRAHGGANRN